MIRPETVEALRQYRNDINYDISVVFVDNLENYDALTKRAGRDYYFEVEKCPDKNFSYNISIKYDNGEPCVGVSVSREERNERGYRRPNITTVKLEKLYDYFKNHVDMLRVATLDSIVAPYLVKDNKKERT